MDPLAHWPDRTAFRDAFGRLLLVASLTQSTRNGRPWADGAWRPPTAAVEATRELVLEALRGHAVSTSDPALAAALTAAGASRLRHAHVLSHRLKAVVTGSDVPAGLAVEPLTAQQVARHADALAAVVVRAYPPSHPDHEHANAAAAAREMRQIGRGEVLGPLMSQSRVALFGGEIVGVCLVVERDGEPPDGGPWVVDMFRDPRFPRKGIGRALLADTLSGASAAGLAGLSLAVSHHNVPAYTLYRRLGFDELSESWTLLVP